MAVKAKQTTMETAGVRQRHRCSQQGPFPRHEVARSTSDPCVPGEPAKQDTQGGARGGSGSWRQAFRARAQRAAGGLDPVRK